MAAAFAVLLGLGTVTTEYMQKFHENSNYNPDYVITLLGNGSTGLRDSGFAYAPTGGIMLNQVNKDGTVVDVCAGE